MRAEGPAAGRPFLMFGLRTTTGSYEMVNEQVALMAPEAESFTSTV